MLHAVLIETRHIPVLQALGYDLVARADNNNSAAHKATLGTEARATHRGRPDLRLVVRHNARPRNKRLGQFYRDVREVFLGKPPMSYEDMIAALRARPLGKSGRTLSPASLRRYLVELHSCGALIAE